MSSISVLQAPGPGQVVSVKTSSNVSSQAPSTTFAGTATAVGASVAQYPNPRVEIDPLTTRVLIEYRDAQTGTPQYQVPSKAQLLLYHETQSQASARTAPTANGSTAV
jgi:hypothetical protein